MQATAMPNGKLKHRFLREQLKSDKMVHKTYDNLCQRTRRRSQSPMECREYTLASLHGVLKEGLICMLRNSNHADA